MYAVIKTGGKQYKVSPGDVVRIENLKQEVGATVEFDQVLAVNNDKEVLLGSPLVSNAKVVATVVENDRSKKVIVFKYKRKKQYRVMRGHLQPFTAVRIATIDV